MDKINSEIFKIEKILSHANVNAVSPFLFGSLGGMTLFYLYLARAKGSDSLNDKGVNLLELCLAKTKTLGSNGSICSGIAGITWLIDICTQEGFIEEEVSDIFPTSDIELAQWVTQCFELGNFDFLHGGTGTFIYLLNRSKRTGIIHKALIQATKTIIEKAVHLEKNYAYIDYYSCSEKKQYPGKVNMGVSHGMISVIYALEIALSLGICKDQVTDLLDKMCNLVQFATEQSFEHYYFPYEFDALTKDVHSRSRIGWCYGDLGSATVLLPVAQRMGRIHLFDQMKKIILNVCNIPFEAQGIRDEGLCHGLIGNALMLKHISSFLASPDINQLSDFYVSRFIANSNSENHLRSFVSGQGYQENLTLLEGVSGIGLGLLSIITNSESKWKEILLLK